MVKRRSNLVLHHLEVPFSGHGVPDSGLTIAHVSDFHFRRWNTVLEDAQNVLHSIDFDLLVATGDFSTLPRRWRHAADMAWRFFEPLRAPLGMYGILGNHDGQALAEQADLPFRLLRDEHVTLNRERSLVLAGTEQSVGRMGDIAGTLEGIPRNANVIMLAHYPSTIHRIPSGRVRLQLSGHTHGGQIRLPGFGCVWCNDRIPVSMARGLHRLGDSFLHISAGLGVSPPIPARFLCPPEITLLTLRPIKSNVDGIQRQPTNRKSRRGMGLPANV